MITYSLVENIGWNFREASTRRWRDTTLPGCVHRDLLRHGLIPDPFWARNEHEVQWVSDRTWEYRAEFTVTPELLAEKEIDLVADGLDTLVTVRVNGAIVGRNDNMFVGCRFPVRRQLRPGRNMLEFQFDSATRYIAQHRLSHLPREVNDPVGGCTRIRKQQCQFGWDWAPRLITVGVWRDLRLEGWSGNRVVDVRIAQRHAANGNVTLELTPELLRPERLTRLQWKLCVINGATSNAAVQEGEGRRIVVADPQRWWPRGHGAQPLYVIEVTVLGADGREIGRCSRRIGLRTIELQRKRDRWGESFQFVVNGRPVFAKGASWIPAHSFVAGLVRTDYEPLLRSAVEANMNMLRVWGGGIYEHECFYDLCDELGLMVWHDFMFSCSRPPSDAAFLKSVQAEAEYQVHRLRHRACLALWCGNNEVEMLNEPDLAKPAVRAGYDAIFRRILPDAVTAHDGVTPYWRSSPSQAAGRGLDDPERSGNTHYWDVWHHLKPVKSYELKVFRFVSEFGMQSFPSREVAETFCPAGQLNIFSPVMENHQKNPIGNRILLDYISRRYRFPKDYAALAYLSQLNQAYCMQVGVEHYRRNQPRCAGTLYWQLNDCWPVSSWSSLEFGGRWKALHHAGRRFYAPVLVSAHVPGDDSIGIGNRPKSTVREVHLHTICDGPPVRSGGVMSWELLRLDGRVLRQGHKRVALKSGESRRQVTLDLQEPIDAHGRDNLYLRIALELGGECVSEDTVFLCPPRMLELQRARTRVAFTRAGKNVWEISFTSPVFQHRFTFDFPGVKVAATSDNWFDLYPGRTKRVRVTFAGPANRAALARALRHYSLVDSYE